RLRVQEVAARDDGIVAGVVELVHDPVDVVPLDRLTERLTDRRPQLLLGRQVVALTPPVVIQQPRPTRRALTDLLRQLERRLRGRLLTRREHRRGLQEPRARALL